MSEIKKEIKPKFKKGDRVMILSGNISIITILPRNLRVKETPEGFLYFFICKDCYGDSVSENEMVQVTLANIKTDEEHNRKEYDSIRKILMFWLKDQNKADLATSEILLKLT
jgi:hypothetical protein